MPGKNDDDLFDGDDAEAIDEFGQLSQMLLERVSDEEKNLLMLKEVEGYSVEELAGMLKMNENTIKVKLFRARQKLVKASHRLDKIPVVK